DEVNGLCRRYSVDPRDMRNWYDGYYMYASGSAKIGEESVNSDESEEEVQLEEEIKNPDGCVRLVDGRAKRLWHIYNPNSVVEAFRMDALRSFWKNTGNFASLQDYITMDYAGLKEDIIHMLAGERCSVNVNGFQNDVIQFKSKDDVLTCLIHMGYLGYDAYTKEAFIPNTEVAEVFEAAIKTGDWDDVGDALRHSDELLRAVWKLSEEKVAKIIASSHQDYASIIDFHDENALALAIMVSFYTARVNYYVVRELPAGKGFADIAFIPKREGRYPAMLVELKWNRSARAAIKQIKDRNYTGALSDYKGELLLIGINYTKKTEKYTCRIEKFAQGALPG
ncbi:MAG: PD-(D/E)XK nuclease domain-containing protein, partial [Lachnospiraceae bacterium]|nr:PD-(D/E)XK nuclease domain-containing protein [Lachnospiraceae bacterium]